MEKYNPPMSVSTCQDGVIFSASYIGWMLPILALISSAITSLATSLVGSNLVWGYYMLFPNFLAESAYMCNMG